VKLKVFQSDKGDCLLLSGKDDTQVLVDGGMRSSFNEHVAPELSALEKIDLVYVSHIDRDHISGVLQLMQDLLDWRVFDFQRESGNDHVREPSHPRPPKVERLWHNAFHDQLEENAGAIEDALAASAAILDGAPELSGFARLQRDVATSIKEGIQLSQRVDPKLLGIPVNHEFRDKLAMVRDEPQRITIGSIEFTVIGPFAEDLEKLRDDWNEWLRLNGPEVKKMREKMERDAGRLATGDVDGFRDASVERALELASSEASGLGDRDSVTVPNLASLMLLAKEGSKTVLLTGDGSHVDILKGLEAAGELDDHGRIHADVLKIQHHGSEHNIDEAFCKRVTADHYVFCANGDDENPDERAVQAVLDARAGDSFKLWFNCSEEAAKRSGDPEHMKKVEDRVTQAAAAGNGRVEFAFLHDEHFFDLPV
jgi:beta-lactamase superfamily II metal-dependent hydrolase